MLICTADFPFYLAMPLLSSLMFASGLLIVKRANQQGVRPLLVTVATNLMTAVVFAPLWWLGGTIPDWHHWWQPVAVAGLYIFGQICTFWALERGDVSVAAPLLSVKVVLVAIFLTLLDGDQLPLRVWIAACIASLGIAIVQSSQPKSKDGSVVQGVVFALLAATTYALFDVGVQRWARLWGAGRLLPIGFLIAGGISAMLWPWMERSSLRLPSVRRPLLIGCLLIAVQSLGIAASIGIFGDAARVNIVYSLRGIWGVVLAWLLSRSVRTAEANRSTATMVSRLIGAALLTAAVVIAIA